MRSYKLPALLVIPAVIFMLVLGTWQVYRLQWKTELIANIKKKMEQSAIDLNKLSLAEIHNVNLKELEFARAKLTGRVDDERIIYLYAGPYKFKGEQGYRVFAPIMLVPNNEILVDLGWIKKEMRDKPDSFLPKDRELTVEGNIMLGEQPNIFTPDNPSNRDVWIWVELAAMREDIKGTFPDFYLMRSYKDDKFPLGKNITPNIRNNHLEYVITWYGLALVLVIIYLYGKKGGKKN